MNIIWTLILTACFSDTNCIDQTVQLFETQEQCKYSLKLHSEIPMDGDWKSITYICKPLGSEGV